MGSTSDCKSMNLQLSCQQHDAKRKRYLNELIYILVVRIHVTLLR